MQELATADKPRWADLTDSDDEDQFHGQVVAKLEVGSEARRIE